MINPHLGNVIRIVGYLLSIDIDQLGYNVESCVFLPHSKDMSFHVKQGPSTSKLGGYTSYVFLRQIVRVHVVKDKEITTKAPNSTKRREFI